jgi:uncharacterized membrane protein
MSVDPSSPVLVHFYRAVVSHADVWRQRMDATTNWAAATTAAMVTFSFGNPGSPPLVLLLAIVFDVIFLVMESRRYQVYDLWRRRFRVLNQYLIAPSLDPRAAADAGAIEENLARVAADLGRTVPHLSLVDAIGYRIRRNYAYLLAAVIIAWAAKLELHPVPAASLSELIARAAIGSLSGIVVLGLMASFVAACAVLTLRAPSEGMLNWTTIPSPAGRLWATSRRWMPGGWDQPDRR